MFQKIRKNKFFRKALVFASVFLILATTLVFPVLAQAPNINYNTYTDLVYTEEVNVDELAFIICGGQYTKVIICESVFNDNLVNVNMSGQEAWNSLYNSQHLFFHSGMGMVSIDNFILQSDFITSWNEQFGYWQGVIVAKDEEIAFKQQQIESANRQYQTLSGQYDDLTNTYNNLLASYNTLSQDYGTLNNNYITLQSDYNTLQSNYDSLLDSYYRDVENAKTEGYTNALNDYKAFEKGLFAIFNAPFTFVSNITGFEIFGISLVEVVVFILIICLAFVLLKFIGGSIL